MSSLLYEKRKGVAYLTLNRPEKRNAMDAEAMVRLADAWQDFAADDDLRVAIVTGAGDTAFSAGADLARLAPLLTGARQPEDEWDRRVMEEKGLSGIALLRGIDLYKPIIAAINGFCVGGGAELMLGTDLRIAADHARFGLAEVKRALIPGGGGPVRLPRQVSYCKAMEILLVGDPIDAQEAHRIGLVNHVVPASDLMSTAETLARKIADNGPVAVRKIKETAVRSASVSLEEGFAIMDESAAVVMATEDAQEGPRAFMEKRAPRYVGR
ncbi:MAG: enoyl-CoA hydratase/isomerase family protein [Planctomycetota bacterium]